MHMSQERSGKYDPGGLAVNQNMQFAKVQRGMIPRESHPEDGLLGGCNALCTLLAHSRDVIAEGDIQPAAGTPTDMQRTGHRLSRACTQQLGPSKLCLVWQRQGTAGHKTQRLKAQGLSSSKGTSACVRPGRKAFDSAGKDLSL